MISHKDITRYAGIHVKAHNRDRACIFNQISDSVPKKNKGFRTQTIRVKGKEKNWTGHLEGRFAKKVFERGA